MVVVFVCAHREFPDESGDERILKIGPHLPKLLSNIKGYTFLGHSVHIYTYIHLLWPIIFNSLQIKSTAK